MFFQVLPTHHTLGLSLFPSCLPAVLGSDHHHHQPLRTAHVCLLTCVSPHFLSVSWPLGPRRSRCSTHISGMETGTDSWDLSTSDSLPGPLSHFTHVYPHRDPQVTDEHPEAEGMDVAPSSCPLCERAWFGHLYWLLLLSSFGTMLCV